MRYGYFDDAAREYVIDRVDVPVSMTNYLGTQRMGTVISHNAGGYSWLDSPQHHRITRFRPNGVPMDWPAPGPGTGGNGAVLFRGCGGLHCPQQPVAGIRRFGAAAGKGHPPGKAL